MEMNTKSSMSESSTSMKKDSTKTKLAKKYKPYPAYVDSGVEWLGEIPKGWHREKIKYLSIVKRGASPRPIDDPVYFDDDGDYSWVRISDVTESDRYLFRTEQRLSSRGASLSVKLEPGALFLSIAASVGKPMIARIKCCIHDGFVYFPMLKENVEYLFYLFSSAGIFDGLGEWGTQLNLNTDSIGNITIPIPGRDNQAKIVAFLDRQTAKIDALLGKYQRLLELLAEKRSALITRAVTKGLDPEAPMVDSGVEWLGEIPKGWHREKIKYLSIVKRGASPRPIDDPVYFDDDGDYSWVRIFDVTESDRYLFRTEQRLSSRGASLSVKLEPGALFLSIAASVGKPMIARIKCCIHDGFVYFPMLKENVEYLFYLFSSAGIFDGLGEWGTQLNLNTDSIGNITIPIPGRDNQAKIAAFLDRETAKIDALVAKVERAVELLKEYRVALISAAVTGKIDLREELV
jgi:type I restriction enzyme S subunit